MPNRGGVGDRAIEALDLRLVGERIAILAEQRASGGHLGLVPLGLDITDGEAGLAARDAQRRHHAVAREHRRAVLHVRRKGRIGNGAEEDTFDVGRYAPSILRSGSFVFLAERRVQTREFRSVRIALHAFPKSY